MIEILPGILETEWGEIEKKLVTAKGFAKSVHIDIMDGEFVDNTTFLDPAPFKKYSQDLILEAHLMVKNPLAYIKPFAEAGFQRFIAHIEEVELVEEFVAEGELFGEVGVAIDGPTDIFEIDRIQLEDLDAVLIMTIQKAGASGQEFTPDMLEKVKEIKERLLFEKVAIEVDGGISENTILQAKEAGATRFVATSAIWNSADPKAAYEKLHSLISS